MNQNIKLRLLSYGVIVYLLMALAWWSVLLFVKNKDAFLAKRDLLKIVMVAEGRVDNDSDFYASEKYLELKRQYHRQELMILGEASVFTISLVIGVWLINRGYHEEMITARQRRNFLLSITHELKSPIASIRLVLETLLKRKLKKEQFEKFSRNAIQETERLNTLVNDLLLSAKLETAYQPNLEEIDLAELFRDIIQQLSAKYPDASFSFRKPPALEPFTGDRPGLTSVALNLFENAVKYSPGKPVIELQIERHNGKIILEITDQGMGIAEKEKKKIFQKFYRVGNEDTRKTKGTGLGLYIVKQIIKTHHGFIKASDNTPKGTVFRIELPEKGLRPV